MSSQSIRGPIDLRVRAGPLFALLLAQAVIAGILVLASPSMERSAVAFGMSSRRLLLASAWLVVLLLLASLTAISYRHSSNQGAFRLVSSWLETDALLLSALVFLLSIAWVSLLVIVVSLSPLSNYSGILKVIFTRTWPIILWTLLVAVEIAVALAINHRHRLRRGSPQLSASGVAAGFIFASLAATLTYYMIFHTDLRWRFPGLRTGLFPVLLAAIVSTSIAALAWQRAGADQRISRSARWLTTVSIFFFALFIFLASSMLVERYYTPSKAYFHLLAEAILQGRLYLLDPPSIHDLVPFQGKLFVAHPPLAALLMIPWILVSGAESVNTVLFSAVLAAGTVSLVYLLLQEMSDRGWTSARTRDILWLSALFGFGTSLWWISTTGEFWFLSQISAITFLALAALVALRGWPAWLAGACLGLAMLARPTVITYWPFLLGITAEIHRRNAGRLSIAPLARWSLISGAGVAVGVLGLLLYNWARFGNVFDTGFTRQNIAVWLADDLRDYGLFHTHYFTRNLRVLLVGLPELNSDCRFRLNAPLEGMSVLLTTPTLLFLVRAWRRTPWVIGSWSAILLSLLILMLYYSTGAWQFGYRYTLDLMIPVIALLALAAGLRMSLLMRTSIVISVVIGAIGVIWWTGGWCP
ncbi:MAG: hypothetical protein ACC700_11975 [Anaerolineales bacterium]